MEDPPAQLKRSTIQIPQKREMVIVGMALLALISFVFLTISYQVVFLTYTVLTIFIFSSYLVLWWDGGKDEPKVPEPKVHPMVSVIIPSFNTKKTIVQCIEACKGMEYSGKFEILVVEDGSTDGSLEMLRKMDDIRLVINPRNMGKAAALNCAIRQAKGEIVACVDSDSYPRKDALQKAVKHFSESDKIASVVVFICVHDPKNLLQKLQEIEYWISFGFFCKTIASIDGLYVTPGPTTFYRKSVLDKLGGFDEKNLTEDMEIALRMQRHGYKIRACHETQVWTAAPDTLPKLYRQRLRWYRGGVMNVLKYIDMFFNPKYGDFGLFILPTTLGSGFFGAFFMAWSILTVARGLFDWLLPVASSIYSGSNLLSYGFANGLLTFQSAWIFGLLSIMLWSFFLVKSFEISRVKPSLRHALPLVLLLWVYPMFLGLVFLVSYISELFGLKYKW